MRLLFIPGFGEDPSIFSSIQDHLPGEKVFLDYWELLGKEPRPELNPLLFAEELVEQYGITSHDVVIGHSTGGWVAYYIKHLVNCPIVQIASWTDMDRVVSPVQNRHLIYSFVKRGLYFNPLVRHYIVWKKYRNKPSAGIFNSVFKRLSREDSYKVINQMRLIFNPGYVKLKVQPDLRIHAREDSIILFPDQYAVEVPGDHFSLWTYPEEVYSPIVKFLEEQQAKNQHAKGKP
ncbi:alpha/beta fold hydrolase [Cesiribacter sp. SM1]|uniref:alpha/beta fold hydrolase n=1 Tax=Cesiribacter sp. SM1 TaxID=2861196 RepID=UPI001CD51C19|nr:alpha/beta hydrolase [Cesiribacter sp. SM1]